MVAFSASHPDLTSTTATLVVDAEDFDREVQLVVDGDNAVFVGFTEAEVDATNEGFRVPMRQSSSSTFPAPLRFVLPADEQLWARAASGGTLYVLVTKVS
jgi:hypothetical protein